MKPYFETANGKLYHGNCLDILPHMDKADLLLTDPPFGIGNFVQITGRVFGKEVKWNNHIPDLKTFKLMRNIAKKRIIWGANYFNCFDGEGGAIIWIKNNCFPNISRAEIASCSFYSRTEVVKIRWDGPEARARKKTSHPCERPVQLYLWCIDYANNPKTVIDPFMGSGSTAVACELKKCKWVGVELNEEYCEVVAKRLLTVSNHLNSIKQKTTMQAGKIN